MPQEGQGLPAGTSISFTALDGPSRGVRFAVEQLPMTIGAGAMAGLKLPGMGIAPSHARLFLQDNEVFLEDLESGKVTRANARTIKRARVQNGDIIELGDVRLLFHVSQRAGKAPEKAAPRKGKAKAAPRVWIVGFGAPFRQWFVEDLAQKLQVEAAAFATGEEILRAMSEALASGSMPSLVVLDLRIPIMNGINVAIAIRAYELGFGMEEKVPLIFMFNPPEQASFEKVLKFCQPIRVVAAGESEEELKVAARKVIKGAKS
jgi:CheY-like chemotaxis protein